MKERASVSHVDSERGRRRRTQYDYCDNDSKTPIRNKITIVAGLKNGSSCHPWAIKTLSIFRIHCKMSLLVILELISNNLCNLLAIKLLKQISKSDEDL